jgi:ParB/RepB/Spo0J family partition protein
MSKHNGKPKPAGLGQMIEIAKISPSPFNPRKTFDKDELVGLAESIAAIGVEVPLIVRPVKRRSGHFELVDGERRYRAAKIAKLAQVPAIVRELTDAQVLEAMLVVDVQRTDIDDLERADGIYKLHTDHGVSVEDIASRIGRSVSTVRQLMRLRDLPKVVRQACKDGSLPTSTALAIARVPGTETRERVGRLVVMGSRYWNGKAPTDADVGQSLKRGQNPLTYRQTRELIAESCYRELKQAPFSRQSLDLISDAGSCDACPKRAGNLKEDSEYANVREDICIDPECYEAKIKAHAGRMLAKCEESGRPVITGAAAARLFSQWNPTQLVSDDWIDLGRNCTADHKNRPYENLLGEILEDKITMAVDPAGTIHRLVPAAAARQALNDLGIKESSGDHSWQKQHAKDRAEDLIRKEAARRCMGLVADKAEAIVLGSEDGPKIRLLDMMRLIVEGAIDRTWDDVSRQVKIRRQLAPKKKERATSGGNRDLVAALVPALDVPGLIGLLAELVAGQKALGFNGGRANDRWWAFFGIDPKAVVAVVRQEKKAGKHTDAPTHPEEPPQTSWRNVPLADMGLSYATEKLLRKKGHLSAGDVADFKARTTPANGKPSRLRDEIQKAIEILRSPHKPGALERTVQRQQVDDDDFDFAGKEAAHA